MPANVVVQVEWNAGDRGPLVKLGDFEPEQLAFILAAIASIYARSHESRIEQRGVEVPLIEVPGVSRHAIAMLELAITQLRANPQADAVVGRGTNSHG